LYSWNLKTWGEKDLPQWNALFGVSFMMFSNLCLAGLLLQALGFNIFLRNELPKLEIGIIMLFLYIVNYFQFIDKGNYRLITKELKKESQKKRRTNTILLLIYVILSFALNALGVIFIRKLNGL